jgi:hypothetical protein
MSSRANGPFTATVKTLSLSAAVQGISKIGAAKLRGSVAAESQVQPSCTCALLGCGPGPTVKHDRGRKCHPSDPYGVGRGVTAFSTRSFLTCLGDQDVDRVGATLPCLKEASDPSSGLFP